MEYWIIENSWGRSWGDEGLVYLKLGKNVLGVETNCLVAEPFLEEFEAFD